MSEARRPSHKRKVDVNFALTFAAALWAIGTVMGFSTGKSIGESYADLVPIQDVGIQNLDDLNEFRQEEDTEVAGGVFGGLIGSGLGLITAGSWLNYSLGTNKPKKLKKH